MPPLRGLNAPVRPTVGSGRCGPARSPSRLGSTTPPPVSWRSKPRGHTDSTTRRLSCSEDKRRIRSVMRPLSRPS